MNRFGFDRSPWRQATLARAFTAAGISLHGGRMAHVSVQPAPPDTGWILRRRTSGASEDIAASWTRRVPQYLCQGVQSPSGSLVRTVEHLLASLLAFAIDNAVIELDADELPIFDGSAVPWCHALLKAGLEEQDAPRMHLRVIAPVEVREPSGAWLRIEPAQALSIHVTSDPPGFGLLSWDGEITPWNFLADIAPSRSHGPILGFPAKLYYTLTRQPRLRGVGFRTIGLTFAGRYLGGMRVPDEPVRHRVLDLVGDLALAGRPLLGRITGHRPRHELNYQLVRALMEQPSAFETVEIDHEPGASQAGRSSGVAGR